MSDQINEAIQEIAVKHGVLLSKDDPVLILQTMNERLLEESRKAQQEMLVQFKEEMENISSQWKDDAKGKAEKILNGALTASKEVMEDTLKNSSRDSILTIRHLISESLAEADNLAKLARKHSWTALFSATILTIICMSLCFLIVF